MRQVQIVVKSHRDTKSPELRIEIGNRNALREHGGIPESLASQMSSISNLHNGEDQPRVGDT